MEYLEINVKHPYLWYLNTLIMKHAEWEDATNYSRDDKERKQTAWLLRLLSFTIWVGSQHIYNKVFFTMHCHQAGFDTYNLRIAADEDVEVAKQAAIEKVRMRLNSMLVQLNTVI